MTKEVMQQALECIERLNQHGWILADFEDEVYAAINALREALAQDKLRGLENLMEESITALKAALEQPEQEPVAYYHPRSGFYWAKPTSIFAPTVVDVPPVPLYVKWRAAQRPWQGLDEDDIRGLYGKDLKYRDGDYMRYAKAIVAKLKERNT